MLNEDRPKLLGDSHRSRIRVEFNRHVNRVANGNSSSLAQLPRNGNPELPFASTCGAPERGSREGTSHCYLTRTPLDCQFGRDDQEGPGGIGRFAARDESGFETLHIGNSSNSQPPNAQFTRPRRLRDRCLAWAYRRRGSGATTWFGVFPPAATARGPGSSAGGPVLRGRAANPRSVPRNPDLLTQQRDEFLEAAGTPAGLGDAQDWHAGVGLELGVFDLAPVQHRQDRPGRRDGTRQPHRLGGEVRGALDLDHGDDHQESADAGQKHPAPDVKPQRVDPDSRDRRVELGKGNRGVYLRLGRPAAHMNSIGEQFKPMPPHGESRLVDGDRLHVTPTPRTPPNKKLSGRAATSAVTPQNLRAARVRCSAG